MESNNNILINNSFSRRFAAVCVFVIINILAACAPAPVASQPGSMPVRIASVSLAADEILYELTGAERVVAVNAYVDDPGLSNVAGKFPAAIPRVRAELERIVQLRPDLVCVNAYNSADFLDILTKSSLPVFRQQHLTSFAGIRDSIRALGARVGEPARADELVRRMDGQLAAIASRLANITKKPRVYYWAASWTAGSETTIHEIITRAGCVNAGAEGGRKGMYESSIERTLSVDPDILLLDARDSLSELPGRELPVQLQQLRAAREGKIVSVPGRALSALSHHVVAGVELLAKAVHPECFAGAAVEQK